MAVSCIIPFFNEQGRIHRVINELSSFNEISEFICVDDGSTDAGYQTITTLSPKISLLHSANNQGKAAAVAIGAKAASEKTLLLMDADLFNIDIDVLQAAQTRFTSAGSNTMLIFRMTKFLPLSRLSRGNILFSGIRYVDAKALSEFYSYRPVNGYQLELALNHFWMQQHWPVLTYSLDADSAFPMQKLGILKALRRDLHTYPDAIAHVGLRSFIKQTLYLGRE